jgi:hypothetical protein
MSVAMGVGLSYKACRMIEDADMDHPIVISRAFLVCTVSFISSLEILLCLWFDLRFVRRCL